MSTPSAAGCHPAPSVTVAAVVGLEGTLEVVGLWNHSMVGSEGTLKIAELRNWGAVGLEGTSEMVEPWNQSMVGFVGTSEITEPQNFLPAPKLSLSLIWKPCPPVLPPPNHAVPDPPPECREPFPWDVGRFSPLFLLEQAPRVSVGRRVEMGRRKRFPGWGWTGNTWANR